MSTDEDEVTVTDPNAPWSHRHGLALLGAALVGSFVLVILAQMFS